MQVFKYALHASSSCIHLFPSLNMKGLGFWTDLVSSKFDLCLLLVGCLKHCYQQVGQKMPVFVKETTLQAAVPSTAAELLTLYPNSPYTSFLVTSRGHISSLEQHCTRLSAGLTRLRSARNGAAKDLTSDGKPNGPEDRDVGPAYDLLSFYKEC